MRDNGAILASPLAIPAGLTRCPKLQLRIGSSVVAHNAVDGAVFDASVVRVKQGRVPIAGVPIDGATGHPMGRSSRSQVRSSGSALRMGQMGWRSDRS